MKKLMTSMVALAIVIGGALAPQAANASTLSPETSASVSATGTGAVVVAPDVAPMGTGQYEYICIGADGSSWSLRGGQKTSDCHGSFLHKYINGKMVANYKLSVSGAIIDHPKPDALNCLMAVVSGAFGVLATDGSLIWISALGWSGLGFITSCLA